MDATWKPASVHQILAASPTCICPVPDVGKKCLLHLLLAPEHATSALLFAPLLLPHFLPIQETRLQLPPHITVRTPADDPPVQHCNINLRASYHLVQLFVTGQHAQRPPSCQLEAPGSYSQ